MAKKKISGLPAGSALNGTELVPIVQTGTTKRITTQDIANLGNSSGVEGSGTINTLAKFTASSTIGNSAFFDDGTNQGTETTTAVNRFIMSANASIAKIFSFRSGNLPRWAFRVDGTESGANAGANFAIRRYNDAGTFIDAPLSFTRSSGSAVFGSSVTATEFIGIDNATLNADNINTNGTVLTLNSKGTVGTIKLQTNSTDRLTIASTGAATFSADATINGVRVGRGAGNIASNTLLGSEAAQFLTTGTNNTILGRFSNYLLSTGSYNTSIGFQTNAVVSTASHNTALGFNANASGNGGNNTAIGSNALVANTASNNTAVGFEAAYSNTTATEMVAIGYQALRANTTGGSNSAFGHFALKANTTGSANISLGGYCLFSNTTGANNVALGYATMLQNTTGSNNTALGQAAMLNNTASNNTAVGFEAAYSNTSGIITAIGYQSLKANTTGLNNTGCGNQTLLINNGSANTAIGNVALSTNTTGSFNNAVGANQQIPNFDSVSMIGVADIATGSNQMRFGSAGFNNGAVTTEVVISDRTWSVFINGTAYKILLKS